MEIDYDLCMQKLKEHLPDAAERGLAVIIVPDPIHKGEFKIVKIPAGKIHGLANLLTRDN